MAAFPGNPRQPLDLRLFELRVRSDGTAPAAADAAPLPSAADLPKGGSLRLLVALLVALGAWLFTRRLRAAARRRGAPGAE